MAERLRVKGNRMQTVASSGARRRPAEVPAPALEADYAPPTGSQGAAIADALRLLAVWAVRVARQGEETAPTPSPAANNPLDFERPSSDESLTVVGDKGV